MNSQWYIKFHGKLHNQEGLTAIHWGLVEFGHVLIREDAC